MKYERLVLNITHLHGASQQLAGRSLNRIMSLRNWLIGAWIVEFEQGGEDRAAYGERLIQTLAVGLKVAGCQGFSVRNLKNFRQVASAYPEISDEAVPLLADIIKIRQTSAES